MERDRDVILKERLFGLTNPEGNHGEDVKENYFYLDSTPTHSYMRGLYKYPQAPFPYVKLVEENRARGKDQREYELLDTGVFDGDRYFDVQVEYAKGGPDDILIRITATNRGPDRAVLHLLPTHLVSQYLELGHDQRGRRRQAEADRGRTRRRVGRPPDAGAVPAGRGPPRSRRRGRAATAVHGERDQRRQAV